MNSCKYILIALFYLSTLTVFGQTELTFIKNNGRKTKVIPIDRILGVSSFDTFFEGQIIKLTDTTILINTYSTDGKMSDTVFVFSFKNIETIAYCRAKNPNNCIWEKKMMKSPWADLPIKILLGISGSSLIGSYFYENLALISGYSDVVGIIYYLTFRLIVSDYAYIRLKGISLTKKWKIR